MHNKRVYFDIMHYFYEITASGFAFLVMTVWVTRLSLRSALAMWQSHINSIATNCETIHFTAQDFSLQIVRVLYGDFPFVFRSARITAVHVRFGGLGKEVQSLLRGGRYGARPFFNRCSRHFRSYGFVGNFCYRSFCYRNSCCHSFCFGSCFDFSYIFSF